MDLGTPQHRQEAIRKVSQRGIITFTPTLMDRSVALLAQLSLLDRLLTPAILISMVIGVLIGEFVSGVQDAFDTATFNGVFSPAIAIGLIIMMWPILTKVQYEALPTVFSSSRIWIQIAMSFVLNWIIGPLVMLGVAWATLPDLPTYRAEATRIIAQSW